MSALDRLRSFAESNEADAMVIREGICYGDVREVVADLKLLRTERDALRELLREAREGVDLIGCSPEGYDELCAERDSLLAKIDAALARKS